jgi:hypothetical protein
MRLSSTVTAVILTFNCSKVLGLIGSTRRMGAVWYGLTVAPSAPHPGEGLVAEATVARRFPINTAARMFVRVLNMVLSFRVG